MAEYLSVPSSLLVHSEVLSFDELGRSRLAPMHIGQYGQFQEWLDDIIEVLAMRRSWQEGLRLPWMKPVRGGGDH